jgi:hypothetical protein
VNGDSKSTNERGPSFLPWACRPITKYYFLTVHYFNSFAPNAQQAGQTAVMGRLSLSMCLWFNPMLLIQYIYSLPQPFCHAEICTIRHETCKLKKKQNCTNTDRLHILRMKMINPPNKKTATWCNSGDIHIRLIHTYSILSVYLISSSSYYMLHFSEEEILFILCMCI